MRAGAASARALIGYARRLHHEQQQEGNRTADVGRDGGIKGALDEGDDDSRVSLFASHHLEELDAAYWKKHAGTPRPSVNQVVELLELRSHWGDEDEDGIDTFDFSLPGEVTNYVISVRFGESGEVEDISMES